MEYNSRNAVIQNLKDAGCSEEMIRTFLDCLKKGMVREQLDLLAVQRKTLLDRIHREQKKIDCLDYLIYQIERDKAAG